MPPRWAVVTTLWVTVAACGRIGFDGLGTTETATEGCGLRDLAVGGLSSCAIDGNGGLWCWGQLGSEEPSKIALPGPAAKVVVGHNHACALLDSGKLRCFGKGDRGQLGDGAGLESSTPVAPVGDKTYVDVAVQVSATCAVTASGTLECWGDDRAGLDASGMTLAPMPVALGGVSDVRRVFSTQKTTCADTPTRRFCWGHLAFAQGIETRNPTEVAYTGAVALGRETACMLENGTVRCIGRGTLGDGRRTATEYDNPVHVLSDVFAIAGGSRVFCAVDNQGGLSCWGLNRSGELGTGDLSVKTVPTRVDLPPVARVAVGFAHACAETRDGVYCWGADQSGQLARTTTGVVRDGVLIAGLPSSIAEVRVVSRTAGGCARTTDGAVWCWGQGADGLTGNPSLASTANASPIAMPFAAVELAIGDGFACARSATQVACWGSNRNGGLGSSIAAERQSTPVLVEGLPLAALSSLTSGAHGMCVLAADVPYCWGTQQAGNGILAAPVPGAPSTLAITFRPFDPGKEHQCLLDQAGTAWCWGGNDYGELGRGVIGTSDPTPMPVTGGRVYSAIATSIGYRARTCAIPMGGVAEIDCWGFYDDSNVIAPTARTLSAVPIALEAAGPMLCALFADGTRDCVGGGYHGLRGDGTADDAPTFEHIGVPATALSLSDSNACFVEADRVRCVGQRRHGALGGAPPSATPMRVALTCK